MQLTQHTDYGLRLLIQLTRKKDQLLSLPAFAADQGLSYHHVAKVAQTLIHEGYVVSKRGRNGGIMLAREASTIWIGDVVRALEPGLRIVDCAHCALRDDCSASPILAEALGAFLAVLDSKTLADAAQSGGPALAAWERFNIRAKPQDRAVAD